MHIDSAGEPIKWNRSNAPLKIPSQLSLPLSDVLRNLDMWPGLHT